MSDQDVLDNWCENPYWQYFSGGEFFEHRPPDEPLAQPFRGSGREGDDHVDLGLGA